MLFDQTSLKLGDNCHLTKQTSVETSDKVRMLVIDIPLFFSLTERMKQCQNQITSRKAKIYEHPKNVPKAKRWAL